MRYLLGRLRHLTVVLLLVTFLTFLLVNVLPGDIAYDIARSAALKGSAGEAWWSPLHCLRMFVTLGRMGARVGTARRKKTHRKSPSCGELA